MILSHSVVAKLSVVGEAKCGCLEPSSMLTLKCWEKQGLGLAVLSIALGFIERMRTSQVALASKIQPHILLTC